MLIFVSTWGTRFPVSEKEKEKVSETTDPSDTLINENSGNTQITLPSVMNKANEFGLRSTGQYCLLRASLTLCRVKQICDFNNAGKNDQLYQ